MQNPHYQTHVPEATACPVYAEPVLVPLQGTCICSNCRNSYTRPPHTHPGQDEYHRCGNCIPRGVVASNGFYQPPQTSGTVVAVHAAPVHVTGTSTNDYNIPLNVFVPRGQAPFNENERVGVCRRCRYTFTRRAGVNDGQSQYYNCESCERSRGGDLVAGSCVVM